MLNTEYYYNKYYSSFHIQYLFLNEYLTNLIKSITKQRLNSDRIC